MIKIPNWVYSTLSLSGSKDDIKRFRDKFEDKICGELDNSGKLEATNVIPYPRDLKLLDKKGHISRKLGEKLPYEEEKLTDDEEKELTLIGLEGKYDINKDGFNQGGYDWCIKNWGTKWGFCDCSVDEEEEGYMSYSFETAWSPITPVIIEMSKQFPKIEFDYFCDEEGGDFRYEVTYVKGVKTRYEDRTHECVEEQRQAEEDYKLEQEKDRKIEDKLEVNKQNGEK